MPEETATSSELTEAMRGLVDREWFTPTADGRGCARLGPTGKPQSIYVEDPVWGEPNDAHSRRLAEQHKQAVRAFKANVTGERLERARRSPVPVRGVRPTRAKRSTTIGRSRAVTRSVAPSRGSPEDEGESSEPPPVGRLCGCGCQADIAHKAPQARYLNETHAAADRQRRKRERDNAPTEAEFGLVPSRCRCNPKGNLVDAGTASPAAIRAGPLRPGGDPPGHSRSSS